MVTGYGQTMISLVAKPGYLVMNISADYDFVLDNSKFFHQIDSSDSKRARGLLHILANICNSRSEFDEGQICSLLLLRDR